MSGYVPLYPYGEYLKDGAQARYSNIIANIFCPSGGSHKCNRSLANQNMIQMLPNQSNIWQKVPLTGLTFNKNSFSFLKESNASPLFIYNNQLNLLLLENVDEGSGARLKLKLYQYDESSKKWTLNNRITSTYMILYKEDLVDSNGNPFNPQFRISPGFNGDFYFPFGNPDTSVGDGENIMRCNLYNNTCRRIFMRNYWRHPEVKGKKVIISNITPGINNTIWVDFSIPLTQGFGSKYLDSAFFKIPTDDGINPVYPTIIEVPPIHAIKPTSERLYAPQVATDVYTNIEAPVTGSGKENC